MFVLDTNILLRILSRQDPCHQEIRSSLRQLYRKSERACFLAQNAVEFWNVCTRPASARGGFGLSFEKTLQRLNMLETYFLSLPEVPAIYTQWKQLVEQHRILGNQVHDARIVAAMLVHGVHHLITYNTADFTRYHQISVWSPAQIVASAPWPS